MGVNNLFPVSESKTQARIHGSVSNVELNSLINKKSQNDKELSQRHKHA
jgi:hypothetical protein